MFPHVVRYSQLIYQTEDPVPLGSLPLWNLLPPVSLGQLVGLRLGQHDASNLPMRDYELILALLRNVEGGCIQDVVLGLPAIETDGSLPHTG